MSINEGPSADALDLLVHLWGEFPELEMTTYGENEWCYWLLRELERAGYLHISRRSSFSHKAWLTRSGIALVSMLPPLDEARRVYFSNYPTRIPSVPPIRRR